MIKKTMSMLLALVLVFTVAVFPASASSSASETSENYTIVLADGTSVNFDSMDALNNYIESLEVHHDHESSPILRYIPCPVGPGPCQKGMFLYTTYVVENGKSKPLYHYYGCRLCMTAAYKVKA